MEPQDLTELDQLFNSEGWKILKQEIEQVRLNADKTLHTISCPNREIYVGKCLGIEEILALEDILKDKIDKDKTNE